MINDDEDPTPRILTEISYLGDEVLANPLPAIAPRAGHLPPNPDHTPGPRGPRRSTKARYASGLRARTSPTLCSAGRTSSSTERARGSSSTPPQVAPWNKCRARHHRAAAAAAAAPLATPPSSGRGARCDVAAPRAQSALERQALADVHRIWPRRYRPEGARRATAPVENCPELASLFDRPAQPTLIERIIKCEFGLDIYNTP